MKVTVVNAVARDLRWIGKLLQIVGATKLKEQREILVGAKLLSRIYSKYVPDDLRLRERTLINTLVALSVNFVRKNSNLIHNFKSNQ